MVLARLVASDDEDERPRADAEGRVSRRDAGGGELWCHRRERMRLDDGRRYALSGVTAANARTPPRSTC